MPAFLKWKAAFSGSYLRCGSSLLKYGSVGGIGWSLPSRAVAAEQRFEHLLAVGGEHQRHADVGIVVGRLVDLHRQYREPAAGSAHNLDPRGFGQQSHSLVVDPVDRVHLAGDQRVETRGAVVDDGDVHAVEKTADHPSSRPSLLEPDPYARVEVLEHERTGANRLRPVLEAVRNHQEMIVGERHRGNRRPGAEREIWIWWSLSFLTSVTPFTEAAPPDFVAPR